jgi:hypothetical protein
MQRLRHQAGQPKIINYLIKFGISAGLLFLILKTVNLQEALASLTLISFSSLIVAFLLQLASTSLAAYRWYLIMRKIGSSEGFPFFLKSYFKGTFFNQGLPTSIGGDAIRILDCSRTAISSLDGFFGVFIDRFAGLAGLLILNIGALLLSGNILPPRIRYMLLAILTLLLVVLVALLYLRHFNIFTRIKWLSLIGQLSERYFQVYSTLSSINIQLALSVLIHLFSMTAIYVLGIGIGLEYPLSVYLVLVPPVILLTILPISLAGWGIREGAMIGFFLLVGADKTKVLSFSILYGLLVLIHSLPGLFVYLAQKNKL